MPLKPCLVRSSRVRMPLEIEEMWPDPEQPGKSISVRVAKVPLPKNGGHVYLSATKFNDIMASRYSDQFFLHGNGRGGFYVRTTHPDYPHSVLNVSRLVATPGAFRRVRLKDRDPCNLRCYNLLVGTGYSLGLERIDPNQDPVTGF